MTGLLDFHGTCKTEVYQDEHKAYTKILWTVSLDVLTFRPSHKLMIYHKCSCLAPALGVTKVITVTGMIWFTLCCAT
jgi:hypothetical protein